MSDYKRLVQVYKSVLDERSRAFRGMSPREIMSDPRNKVYARRALKALDDVIDVVGEDSSVAIQYSHDYENLVKMVSAKTVSQPVKGGLISGIVDGFNQLKDKIQMTFSGLQEADFRTLKAMESELEQAKAKLEGEIIPAWNNLIETIENAHSAIHSISDMWTQLNASMPLSKSGSAELKKALLSASQFFGEGGMKGDFEPFYETFDKTRASFEKAQEVFNGALGDGGSIINEILVKKKG